jgi:ribosome-associated protein
VSGSRDLATRAARAASEKQARDIVVLDVRDLIVITDYFVICSGASERQVRTIADEMQRTLRSQGMKPLRREGEREGRWVLLDFVDFVAHVFLEEEREYYGLERLWADAPPVSWDSRAASGE